MASVEMTSASPTQAIMNALSMYVLDFKVVEMN